MGFSAKIKFRPLITPQSGVDLLNFHKDFNTDITQNKVYMGMSTSMDLQVFREIQ